MSDWTEDRVERLKVLWTEGLSCSQCARALGGGVTRNAVISKVHRLGLPQRATAQRTRRKDIPRPPPKPKLVIVRQPGAPAPEFIGPVGEFPPRGCCQYTPDDIGLPAWRMCGHPVYAPGTSWCIHHAGIVFQPQQTAASRRKSEAVDARAQDRQMRRMGL